MGEGTFLSSMTSVFSTQTMGAIGRGCSKVLQPFALRYHNVKLSFSDIRTFFFFFFFRKSASGGQRRDFRGLGKQFLRYFPLIWWSFLRRNVAGFPSSGSKPGRISIDIGQQNEEEASKNQFDQTS